GGGRRESTRPEDEPLLYPHLLVHHWLLTLPPRGGRCFCIRIRYPACAGTASHCATSRHSVPPRSVRAVTRPSAARESAQPSLARHAGNDRAARRPSFTSFRGTSRADPSRPSLQAMSTVTPPRARSPVTDPAGQAAGNAGSRCSSPPCDWSSISAMPAVAPKLPSIWNGGCVLHRFGSVLSRSWPASSA